MLRTHGIRTYQYSVIKKLTSLLFVALYHTPFSKSIPLQAAGMHLYPDYARSRTGTVYASWIGHHVTDGLCACVIHNVEDVVL